MQECSNRFTLLDENRGKYHFFLFFLLDIKIASLVSKLELALSPKHCQKPTENKK